MNKSAGVLLGIVVAVGAISAGGAWYTGTKLEGVLQQQIVESNKELQAVLIGYDATASLELVSLDRGVFSSNARYRLKGQGDLFRGDLELLISDHIEHGPLPFSRLVRLKWLPVMASSRYELEKSPQTEKWFAATKGAVPFKGVVNVAYDLSADGTLELAPVDLALDEQSSLKFSGLNATISVSDSRQKAKVDGYVDSLSLAISAPDQAPGKLEVNGLTLASNLTKSSFGYYLGQNTLELSNTKATFGDKQSVLTLKNFEQKTSSEETGSNVSGRADYRVGEIAFDGKTVGSAEMLWSMKNLDSQGMVDLVQVYQNVLQPYQKAATEAAARGEPAPELQLTPAEETKVRDAVNKVLAAKPQIALESLALKTGNGESRFSLGLDLAKPQNLELPTAELGKQLISQLDAKLSLSKPMVADVAALQAQAEGMTDAKQIAEQSAATAEMLSAMAVATQLAKLDGNNVVSALHYANNEVNFNGQKMTVEQFIGFVMSKVAGAGAQQ
ncbi:YdgA family protein [Pseudomonas sp. MSSRFD41]|uniref:YdgA family protein n=1 Tax=Pseudomonas sp. MSSRFD41 TaxID=1310370 RepID=UPI001639B883|nr:YdgA family protein [Pseudomonas sp. MSSRFD41]MBC2659466.1 YdgA family protein [Pseudomonas sp. MSSRFD41]